MKIRQLFEGISIGSKEISDILSRSDDFRVGIEYEMRFSENHDKTTKRFLNTYNLSYRAYHDEHDNMTEIKTYPLKLEEALVHIKTMFSAIENEGIEIPEMAGLHISISSTKYNISDFNKSKFLVLMNSDYLHKLFPERKHVKNVNDVIREIVKNNKNISLKTLKDIKEIEEDIEIKLGEKFQTIKISDHATMDGRIELRFFGGTDHHKMYKQIKQELMRALFILEIAYTNLYQKEYYKQLSKIIYYDNKSTLSLHDPSRQDEYDYIMNILKHGTAKEAYDAIRTFDLSGKKSRGLSGNVIILKKLEKLIATDSEISLRYAKNILQIPFEKGEKAIAQDDDYSKVYYRFLMSTGFFDHAKKFKDFREQESNL